MRACKRILPQLRTYRHPPEGLQGSLAHSPGSGLAAAARPAVKPLVTRAERWGAVPLGTATRAAASRGLAAAPPAAVKASWEVGCFGMEEEAKRTAF